MSMSLRKSLLVVLAGCLLMSLARPALAESVAGIKGVVLDKDGAPIPGATVTISNESLGVSQGAVTDAKGEFRIAPLPPGKNYRVRVAFPTMSTVTLPDIEVAAGRISGVPVTLRPSSELTERMKVTAKAEVVNTEQTTTQTNFSAEFIDSLPILGRNYQDVLTLAPGVSDDDGDGNPNIHGARDTDVVTLVDGVSTSDPFSGKVGQQLNLDSIQEIEVKTSGATAEYGRAQGGFVNIVTKSGGNEFEGRAQFYWRSNIMDGDGAGIDNPRIHGGLGEKGLRDLKFADYLPFLSLSGPIKKDKAWYYFTAEYIQLQEPVNALTQAFVRGTTEKRIFAKVSWDVSTNHKLVFTTTVDPQEFTNQGIDSLTAIESGYTQREGGTNLVLKETSVFSPNVFLETTVQHFTAKPQQIGTLNPDTNHNGILFIDRDHNGFLDATERDPGQDFDRDGKWDVFEDVNHNGVLESPHISQPTNADGSINDTNWGEDLDHDGHLTPSGRAQNGLLQSTGGCEGRPTQFDHNPAHVSATYPNGWPTNGLEDFDCDGHLDFISEDDNHNGILLPQNDRDGDHFLDMGFEDRNHDNLLNDTPTPMGPADICPIDPVTGLGVIPCDASNRLGQTSATYPYDTRAPLPADRDFQQDQSTLRTSGPNNYNYDRQVGRITLRQDLTVFVADWHGQHDMKFGGVVERERYDQDTFLRPELYPKARPAGVNSHITTVGVSLPTQGDIQNNATSTTFGMYFQDTYKPLPNLTIGLGLRFDREATDSFGYTPFDPVAERNLYDDLRGLTATGEQGLEDATQGNDDGIQAQGYCSDPIFIPSNGQTDCKNNTTNKVLQDLNQLKTIARSRLTQHHFATALSADALVTLFPDAVIIDPVTGAKSINVDLLRSQGATFEERQPFRLTNNNLAPRLSISWDPWGDSKTKIFGNWSRFYDKLFLNSVITEEGPDQILRYYKQDPDGVNTAGIPDNQIGSIVTKAPPDASQIDRGLQTPYSDEFTMGFERELAPEVSLKITYIQKQFRAQLQDRDINHTVRFGADGKMIDAFGTLSANESASAPSTPAKDGRPDLFVEDFFFNQIFRLGNYNHARYKGIEIEVTKRLSRKWQLEASYTYARAIGNAEDFQSTLGDDPSSIPQQFGYLNYDQRHSVKLNAITYLPGDWQLGGVLSWQSGYPYSVIDRVFSLDSFEYPQQRTLFGQVLRNPSGDPVFDPVQRNSRRNPSQYNIDVRAQRAFVLGKFNSKLFITVENLLNTDDLRISEYDPASPDRGGSLQVVSERRFGRRFELGFQFEF